MGPKALAQVMRQVDTFANDDRLLVGLKVPDDAGVFRLDEGRALVQSVDFFTPVVDDPADFGAIATANALSDIYAMGAEPLTAMNLVAFPQDRLPLSVLSSILSGSAAVLRQAGVALVGGHSIDDPEPKFGLAVTGLVHPDSIITLAGAEPGDRLILTKPIGVGIVTTAMKRDLVSAATVAMVVGVMKTLNAGASKAMRRVGVHAATDITGFGLLGHAAEMAKASGVTLHLEAPRIPIIPGACALAEQGVIPGGTQANLDYLLEKNAVRFPPGYPRSQQLLLADAVTSGGLLIAVAPDRVDRLRHALDAIGAEAHFVGEAGIRRGRTDVSVFSGD